MNQPKQRGEAAWTPGDPLPGAQSQHNFYGQQPMLQLKPANDLGYAGASWSADEAVAGPWSWLQPPAVAGQPGALGETESAVAADQPPEGTATASVGAAVDQARGAVERLRDTRAELADIVTLRLGSPRMGKSVRLPLGAHDDDSADSVRSTGWGL